MEVIDAISAICAHLAFGAVYFGLGLAFSELVKRK